MGRRRRRGQEWLVQAMDDDDDAIGDDDDDELPDGRLMIPRPGPVTTPDGCRWASYDGDGAASPSPHPGTVNGNCQGDD